MIPASAIKKVFSSKFWLGAGATQPTQSITQPVTQPKKLILTSTIQPQASFPTQSFGPGFYTPGDTRFSGGKTVLGLDSYYGFKVIDHYAARSQARKADQESIEARTLLKRNNSYVIGRGLRLDPTPDFKILGLTREQVAEWSANVKRLFHLWAKSTDSDVTGINNFYQNMRFAHRQKDRDGEAFPRFNYSKDTDLLNPLQIGFIDPNQIRGDEFTFSTGPITQQTGLVKDKNGKTIAFDVWINDPEDVGKFKTIKVPARDKKSGMPLMLHMFEPEYPGQTRGIPKITHAIQDFQDITGYHKAALQRMENGATLNFTAFNKQQDPGDFGMSDLSDDPAGITTKTESTESTAPSAPSAEVVTCTAIPEATVRETGINVFEARQGDELKATPDLSPGETAKEYIDGRISHIAPSMGMSPEVAAMRTNSSFTAAKGAFGLQDGEAKIERDDIESDFANPAYKAWMFGEIAAGRIQAPGWSVPVLREAWLKNRWIAEPPIVLNPQQEATAAKINIELGREDLATSAENLNGSDFESNAAKLTDQLPLLPTTPYPAEEPEPVDENETDKQDDDQDDNSKNIIKLRSKQ